MASTLGEQFAEAIAAKNAGGLLDLLAPEVDFRAVTPGKFWETSAPEELVHDFIFGHWFEPTDIIDGIERIETGSVIDVQRVGYAFRVSNSYGPFLVEQQAYFKASEDRIEYLRIVCSGYQAVV